MKHRARKRFGQNFLHDGHVIARIVAAIRPRPGQHLVEIGPGQGALTEPLFDAAGELDVVELDRDLIPLLEQRFSRQQTLRIHQADALKFDFSTLRGGRRGATLRVVGNLPYNISTPLLFHLLSFSGLIKDMHFMLQKEVVERLAAPPGGGDYGRLSVMMQYHCQVERLFVVKPGSFTPVPKVDSAIVRLTPHATPPVELGDGCTGEEGVARLRQVVTQAFAQRRKTLRNNLKGVFSTEQIEALDIDPGLRPEVLTLAQYAQLARALGGRGSAG